VLSREVAKLPNKIFIEGHTDCAPYAGKKPYDNWYLSTARANEARRLMQSEGVRSDQISQVRGFADREPRIAAHPEDPSNRRVTLIVQYEVQNNAEVAPPSEITRQNATAPHALIDKPVPAANQTATREAREASNAGE
jgi:chemotaxis protein MotB